MSIPVNIDLSSHKRGDLWEGITAIGPVLINGLQPTEALSRVRMHFVKRKDVFTLDSDSIKLPDAPITISNATTWEVVVPEVQKFIPTAGIWAWDMEFYSGSNTAPQTFYSGTITVIDDITK
jgi:hypothetical protein